MMGGLLHAGLLLLSLAALSARAEPLPRWEAGAGIAAVNFPDYRGSDQRHTWVLPVPYFVYRGEFLQVDERRMRGLFLKTEKAEVDVSVNGSVPVKSNDNESRRGMPDLDPTLEIGPSLNFFLFRSEDKKRRLELRLPVRAVIASDFSHVRSAGWVFQPNLNLDVRDPLGYQGWNLGLLGGPLFSDRRYNRYFYAVDPAFATADRPAYTAGGGYAGTQFIAALSKRHRDFWAGGFVKWDTLNSAAFADSPLVKTRQYFAAGFAVAWILGESKTTVEATR
jgi:outer membrane scaffolding protein for murein synthesis (MipA/OmpV family)